MLAALRVVLIITSIFFLYFYGLTQIGLLGPDEPRYVSIGREMNFSGDWITPILWGDAWFEKPPLEYWGIAAAFALGIPEDLAPRIFNALLGAFFLGVFWWVLVKEFSLKVANISTAILATSAAWVAESRIAVMDLPLSVTFGAAMLLALHGSFLLAAVMLGLAVLAKGLVALILVIPALWFFRTRWRELILPTLVFLAIAQPWYIAMTGIHGMEFINELFIRHHFSRFSSESLQHVQPFWFFIPVILGFLFPWTPLVGLLRWSKDNWKHQYLFVWFLWALIFFSLSKNKLPGYILPAIPPLAALLGIELARAKREWLWCGACGAMLGITVILADVLPAALAHGLSRADVEIRYIPALLIAIGGLALGAWQKYRGVALLTVVIVPLLVYRMFPVLEDQVSVRGFWKTIEEQRGQVCIESMHRSWRYGLNYYSIEPLPDCSSELKSVRITQQGSKPPQILVVPQIRLPAQEASPDPGAF